MNEHELTGTLSTPISLELLGSDIPARLAYIGVDGDPRVVPVGFLWTDGRIVVGTVTASARCGRCGSTRGWR